MLQLYDFGSRNYDPILGRWFNIDPALQFTNPYLYCGNSPMMYIDPDGEDAIYISFPGYKAGGVPFTGHAGVLLIDNDGTTRYYEYGTYGGVKSGIIREWSTPDEDNIVPPPLLSVTMGDDEMPTTESLDAVLQQIAKRNNSTRVEGAYFKSDDYDKMNNWVIERMTNSAKMDAYSLFKNNCATFAQEVISQDKSIDLSNNKAYKPKEKLDQYDDKYLRVSSDKKGTELYRIKRYVIEYYQNEIKKIRESYDRETGTTTTH